MSRNIDFLAVGVIAVMMLGFSWASSLRLDHVTAPIRFENVVNTDRCPIQDVLSRIDYILNQ